MSEVDELFGSDDGAKPNRALVLTLVASGVLLTLVGLACSILPGGVLILLGFHYADREVDRVEAGYLAESDRPEVERLRLGAQLAVVWLFVVTFAQFMLFQMGFYEAFWDMAILAFRTAIGGG